MTDTFDRLNHIREAIMKIMQYIRKGRDKFDQEEETQLVIIHYLMIIGEAASTIPQDFRNSHPDIPWRDMISTRNRLIHHYDGVNLDVV